MIFSNNMVDQNVIYMYIFAPVLAVIVYIFLKIMEHFKW